MGASGAADSEENIPHDNVDHEALPSEGSANARRSESADTTNDDTKEGDDHSDDGDNGSDQGEGEEADESDDEDEEEPRFKYANLTKKLGSLYRNGDATSSLLTAGDKMVCAPRVVYCCEGSRELTSSRLDNWNT